MSETAAICAERIARQIGFTLPAGLVTAQVLWHGATQALNVGVAPADGGQRRIFIFWHEL